MLKKEKLRRVSLTPEQLVEQQRMYFELPRKYCEQIAPSMLRLKMKNRHEQARVLKVVKKMLKRARIPKVSKQIQHIVDFDKSESIVPHGEVSKRIYTDIFVQRDFDLYGRPMPKQLYNARKVEEMKMLARMLGVEYTRQQKKLEGDPNMPDIFEDITKNLVAPIISTAKWKIGHTELYNPPVGLASNPAQPFKSQGNEAYYAYDGEWKDGKMHGLGKYLHEDGCIYEGQLEFNWPHGLGFAVYPCKDEYNGFWRKGRYNGEGTMTTAEGTVYTGFYYAGRRHGYGKITYPSGLTYEGNWCDGKPHGRGRMHSKKTQYAFEGEFVK